MKNSLATSTSFRAQPQGANISAGLRAKLIAMYFPQLHAIPENDEWWGKGFTDWDNVRPALPQFDGHYQPRVPLNKRYYDQSELETLQWQIELAKSHGVYGFCHYHYWFDGKQLLETPTNMMLENPELDFPFCLSWANETWSRRWDGMDHHILIQQTHPPTKESWDKHFSYLIKAWSDPRAIKVSGKPVFIIYRPHRIERINDMLDYWRVRAEKAGLPGLYFIAQKQYAFPNEECISGFDAIFQFQPFESIFAANSEQRQQSVAHRLLSQVIPGRIKHVLRMLCYNHKPEKLTFYNYDEVWERILEIQTDGPRTVYPGAFVDWDNTARYKKRATIFQGACPERFEHYFTKLVETMPERQIQENFIFLNAWNEWSEGTYLEPDEKYGYQYLEAVRNALSGKKAAAL